VSRDWGELVYALFDDDYAMLENARAMTSILRESTKQRSQSLAAEGAARGGEGLRLILRRKGSVLWA